MLDVDARALVAEVVYLDYVNEIGSVSPRILISIIERLDEIGSETARWTRF